jgi:hypothetical protein
MRTRTLSLVLFGTTALAAAVVAACSSDSGDAAQPKPTSDAGDQPDTAAPADDGAATPDARNDTSTGGGVTFRYTPAWKGATKVEVYGAFGTAMDWKQPFLTLADDGSGSFTGTAQVPPGQIPYVFKITGDEASAKPAAFTRFAVDPGNPDWVACPAESPTFDKNAPNPCSQLTSPQSAAAPTYHFKGMVTVSGAPASGYLVEMERIEPKQHHFFANRVTTGADGAFDMTAATGTWRVQVLHPTFLSQTDAQRDPASLAAIRRSICTGVLLTQDTTVNAAEVSYGGYATMAPQGDAGVLPLPAAFTYTVLPGTTGARLTLYGPGASIGDPWYSGPLKKAGAADFDGGFNTNKAADGGLVPDAEYWWGTEQEYPGPDGGVGWSAQTMVLPVRFQ